jgi:predicted GH43/DUF377 family glycosyl hydrolase
MPKLKDMSPYYEEALSRSIEITHTVQIERMNNRKPILTPKADSSWESKVVLNPAAVLVDDANELTDLISAWKLNTDQREELLEAGGAVVMLYRAQGEVEEAKKLAPSSAGLAVFTPHLKLVWRKPEPAISPTEDFHNLGVEDGRCTKVDDTYYFFYTGYYSDSKEEQNKVQICLATTKNFIEWEKLGPIRGNLNEVDNKNAVLLPDKVYDEWVLLHRPMQGKYPKTIHWATSKSLTGPWTSKGMCMASYQYDEFSESWIGAGGPPISLGNNRFLTFYHQGHYTANKDREYDIAVTILDFSQQGVCKPEKRMEPLMRPSGKEEQQGDEQLGVDNVLFVCANYELIDDIILPYAGADSRIFGARINKKELLEYLL